MSFGKLDFNGKVWRASDLRPHVSIRFKDMFKGIRLGDRPPFDLIDRADRATDLDWFMQRYPLEMTPAAKARLPGLCAAA